MSCSSENSRHHKQRKNDERNVDRWIVMRRLGGVDWKEGKGQEGWNSAVSGWIYRNVVTSSCDLRQYTIRGRRPLVASFAVEWGWPWPWLASLLPAVRVWSRCRLERCWLSWGGTDTSTRRCLRYTHDVQTCTSALRHIIIANCCIISTIAIDRLLV